MLVTCAVVAAPPTPVQTVNRVVDQADPTVSDEAPSTRQPTVARLVRGAGRGGIRGLRVGLVHPGVLIESGEAGDRAYVVLEGSYSREGWSLYLADTRLFLGTAKDFQVRIPIQARSTLVRFVTEGPDGATERDQVTIAVSPWQPLERRLAHNEESVTGAAPELSEPEPAAAETPLPPRPLTTLMTPSASGGRFGTAYITGGIINRIRHQSNADSTLAFGVGLGDPDEWLGVELQLVLPKILGDTFSAGAVGFKLSRAFGASFATAFGVEQFASWGESSYRGPSTYVVATGRLPLSVVLTAGVGNGRFAPGALQRMINTNDAFEGPWNLFGSASFRVLANLGVIADWSGDALHLGVSWTPIPSIPLLTLNPVLFDLAGSGSDGLKFLFNVTYGFPFLGA